MNIQITEQKPMWGVNVDVGFNGFVVRRRDFIAAGIQWFERWDRIPGTPPVSHAFVITGPDTTVEAFNDGVKAGRLSLYLQDPDVALLVRKPKGWTSRVGRAIAGEALCHIGERYDYTLIAAMAVSNTFIGRGLDWVSGGRFGRAVEGWADRKHAEICSELAAKSDATGFLVDVSVVPTPALPGCLGRLKPFQITPAILFGDNDVFEKGAVELI